jgi:hypothetical protein
MNDTILARHVTTPADFETHNANYIGGDISGGVMDIWQLFTRPTREETAAMRSQANTAKLLEGNPTLMRLRELEVLEKVALAGRLNVVLGEKGLADKAVNLL